MDATSVAQSIMAVNEMLQSSIAQTNNQAVKLMKMDVEMAVAAGKEAGKGQLIDATA